MKLQSLIFIRELLEREVYLLESAYRDAVQKEADAECDMGSPEYISLRDARRDAYGKYDKARSVLVEFDIRDW